MNDQSLFAAPAEPKPGTQQWYAVQALRQGPVCSFHFYHHEGLTHRLAARIKDLRDKGWRIVSEPCVRHSHTSNAVEYRLDTP